MFSLFRMSTVLPIVSLIFALEILLVLGVDPPVPTPTPSPSDVCAAKIVNMTLDTTNATRFAACNKCVERNDTTAKGCSFFEETTPKDSLICAPSDHTSQFTKHSYSDAFMCRNSFGPYTPDPNTTTTTTTQKPTTTTITPPPSPTPVPSNGTTTPTTAPPSSSTTPASGNTTTPLPITTPAPAPSSGGSFSFANFLGGIVFTLAVSSLAYVGWRFYKARNPNYHTF